MIDIKVQRYSTEYERVWDEFLGNSINGIFLQSRNFLNYHGKNKFNDMSLLFYEGDNLVAICPGCVEKIDDKKVFISNKGSSYGGIIIGKEYLRIEKISKLIEAFEKFIIKNGVFKCIIKMSMDILCELPQDVVKFCLYYYGYTEYKELNFYIDFNNYNEDIIKNCSKMKKRNIKKALKSEMEFKKLHLEYEIKEFHTILTKNLKKYNVKPVHSVEELMDLKDRLGDGIQFYGAYLGEQMVAGTMLFIFENVKCVHTQYLAYDAEYQQYNSMAFIYYKIIEICIQNGINKLSWGIATEHNGENINWGLANNKEEFGSIHGINSIYEKVFRENE